MTKQGYLYESQNDNQEQVPSFMAKIRRLEFLAKQKEQAAKTGSEFIQEEAEAAAKARKDVKVRSIILLVTSLFILI